MSLTTLNVLDGLIIIILGWNLIRGFNKGFIEEILSIIGIIASIYLAYVFAPQVTKFLVDRPDQTTTIISGILLFAFFFAVSKYIALYVNKKINETAMGILNNLLGFLFGIIRGWLLASIAVFLVAILTPDGYLIKRSSLGGLAIPIVEKSLQYLPLKDKKEDPIIKNWLKAEKFLRKNFLFKKYIGGGGSPPKSN